MTAGIYIHIPFCRKKCDYCNFYSVPAGRFGADGEVPEAYMARLHAEIRKRLPGMDISGADTIYFGGGTPSLMTPAQIWGVLDMLGEIAIIERGAEITLEMNPGDASRGRLTAYRDAGVNRIVLGVQTFSGRLHRLIGRSAEPCTARDLDMFFSVPGIDGCIDLITGIPSQSEPELNRDIDLAAAYRPRHISAYLLSVEKKTPLGGRFHGGPAAEDDQRRLFELTMARLQARGYEHYEISNYALPGFESRHNMKYWSFEPYAGFGPGSHSFMNNERSFNAMPVHEYIQSEQTIIEHDPRPAGSAAAEYFLTGLRLIRGISIRDAERRLEVTLPESVLARIMKAEEGGTIIADRSDGDLRIRLSAEGIVLSDSVIYDIVEPLL
ncbi:MAG: hypothetical protein A2176_10870 [Spirochaetes bacterium RBG_13_51_14]|nr:MAG: hypothetical protein A2176_10870 [Spirochaetes bacterium RBG_13_51_14]